jgi:hypothetical protein
MSKNNDAIFDSNVDDAGDEMNGITDMDTDTDTDTDINHNINYAK